MRIFCEDEDDKDVVDEELEEEDEDVAEEGVVDAEDVEDTAESLVGAGEMPFSLAFSFELFAGGSPGVFVGVASSLALEGEDEDVASGFTEMFDEIVNGCDLLLASLVDIRSSRPSEFSLATLPDDEDVSTSIDSAVPLFVCPETAPLGAAFSGISDDSIV